MFHTALRNLVAHKLRLLATGLAVTLGVAFMAGTLVLTDTIQKNFDDLFATAYDDTDALVRQEASFEDPNGWGDVRGRFDESILSTVAAVPGVASAEGDVWGFAQVVDTSGEPIGDPGMGPPTFGTNWATGPTNSWDLVAGEPPRADDEVVLDKGVADDGGYTVGDRATVLVSGAPVEATVTGIARIGGSDSPGGATFAMFTTDAAQRYFGEVGKFDSISVSAEPGVSEGEVTDNIAAVLPEGMEVVTGETLIEENQDAARQGFSFFNTFMLVFAVIALLVGGFMIFNTFFITVAQRTRENALLRAVGASRRQVLLSVLVEALGVGIVASAIGLAAGVLVAAGLKELLAAFGFDPPAGGVVFTASTAIIAFTAGVVVTMVAAISPARKAGKVPPVAAMRDVAVGSSGYGSKERIFVGLGLLAVGGGALAYGLFATPSNALAVVGLGVLVVFFAVSILGRTVSLPISRVLGFALPRLRGIAGKLARENAMRNPKRTAATASALMIGVGLVSFITIFAASTKASFEDNIDSALNGDVIVTSGQFGMGGVSPDFTDRLNELPEVDVAGGIRAGTAEVDGSVEQLVGASPGAFAIYDIEPIDGSVDDLDADAIAVQADEAEAEGYEIGDTVPVDFQQTGVQTLEIAMVFDDETVGDWMLGTAAFEANFASQLDTQIFITKADDVTSDQLLAAVEREADAFPGTKVLDQSEYKEEQTQFVDQLLGLVYALLALAIVIALLGIGNTLALSIYERTRELGVLRAVGMTRRQLRQAIRWESVIIAVQGTLLGLVIGVVFGWALVRALADEGMGTFALPVTSLVVVIVLAALAGVAAAVLPARRAAKLDVLRAVVSE